MILNKCIYCVTAWVIENFLTSKFNEIRAIGSQVQSYGLQRNKKASGIIAS